MSIPSIILFGVTLRCFLSGDEGSGPAWLMMSCSSAANQWLKRLGGTNAKLDLIPLIITCVDLVWKLSILELTAVILNSRSSLFF